MVSLVEVYRGFWRPKKGAWGFLCLDELILQQFLSTENEGGWKSTKIEGGWKMMFLLGSHRCNLVYPIKKYISFSDPKQCCFYVATLPSKPTKTTRRFRKALVPCFVTSQCEKNTNLQVMVNFMAI